MYGLRENPRERSLRSLAVDGIEPKRDADDRPEERDEGMERERDPARRREDVQVEEPSATGDDRGPVHERAPHNTHHDQPQQHGRAPAAKVVSRLFPEDRQHCSILLEVPQVYLFERPVLGTRRQQLGTGVHHCGSR